MDNSILINPNWLNEQLQRSDSDRLPFLLIDTRGAADYESGHIPGALNLPSNSLYDPNTPGSDLLPVSDIERVVSDAGIDNETQLILYDDSGLVPSARVFWALENLGRGKMALLDGGLIGWIAKQFPVVATDEHSSDDQGSADITFAETKRSAGGFRASAEGLAFATRDDVLAATKDENTILIDTRTEDEYYGRNGVHERNGHIPGAKHIDWQNNIVDLFNPTLKSEQELRSLYEGIGVSAEKQVIVYCRTASRSSHTYFVLRLLGFEKVRNYKGSWMEWNIDPSLPVSTD